MRIKIATTIKQLILIGFFLVALTLTAGIISTVIQVDKLSNAMKSTVQNSSQIIETSRIVVSQVLSLERTAGQYLVLYEDELLKRYQNQREQLLTTINSLLLLPVHRDTKNTLDQLTQAESGLWDRIQTEKGPVGEKAEKVELPDLSGIIRSIPADVSDAIARMSRSMERKVFRVKRSLLIQALALIPLAIILATVFSVLITRPMNQLLKTIRNLGSADFTTPIKVSGPEDISELGKRLDWLREKLAAIDQQKMDFLQHISHELKTPLTALREGVALMEEGITGPLTADQIEVVGILKENCLQLQKEVEALLDFNFALTQDKPLGHELLQLDAIVKNVVKQHRLELRSRGIKIKGKVKPLTIKGNFKQLTTVVDNLISNAIKYSPSHSLITITLLNENNNAILDVIDKGPGIISSDSKQIFKPFYQGANKSRGSVSGTGLGLAIAKRYVMMHQGSLRLQDADTGAHFRMRLPLEATGVTNECKAGATV